MRTTSEPSISCRNCVLERQAWLILVQGILQLTISAVCNSHDTGVSYRSCSGVLNSNYARGWTIRVRIPTGARFSLLWNVQTGYGAAHSFLFNGHSSSFPEVKWQGLELTTHLHRVPRIRMSGAAVISTPLQGIHGPKKENFIKKGIDEYVQIVILLF